MHSQTLCRTWATQQKRERIEGDRVVRNQKNMTHKSTKQGFIGVHRDEAEITKSEYVSALDSLHIYYASLVWSIGGLLRVVGWVSLTPLPILWTLFLLLNCLILLFLWVRMQRCLY